MTECRHNKLTRLPSPQKKLRCRHCHLTIDREELGSDDCPECLETTGTGTRDFEEIEPKENSTDTYRCEACGIFIETPEP